MRNDLLDQILSDRPVAFHPELARLFGGVGAALFFQQIRFWMGVKRKKTGEEHPWVYKSQAEIEEETALTRYEQESARKKLRDAGVLEEDLRGVPATKHYRVDIDAVVRLHESKSSENPVCGKPADQYVENQQTGLLKTNRLNTESTSESTSEITTTGEPESSHLAEEETKQRPQVGGHPLRDGSHPPKAPPPRVTEMKDALAILEETDGFPTDRDRTVPFLWSLVTGNPTLDPVGVAKDYRTWTLGQEKKIRKPLSLVARFFENSKRTRDGPDGEKAPKRRGGKVYVNEEGELVEEEG